MPAKENKYCERCKASFECMPDNITECQCFGVTLSDAAKEHIAVRYEDCLCRNCLLEINKETA